MPDLPATRGRPEAVVHVDGRHAARVVLAAGLAIEVGLVLLDYYVNYGRLTEIGALRRLTNIAREDGLASWFGTTQTLLVALTAWVLWAGVRVASVSRWQRRGWLLVAALFTYMAVDDGTQLHERLGTAYRAAGGAGSGLFPSFSWQLLFVPVLGLAVMAAGGFLWRELRSRFAAGLVVAALLMFAVAVVLDFFEGLDRDHRWNVYTALTSRFDLAEVTRARFRQSPYATLVHFSRAIEEFLEMLAMTCLWAALLRQLEQLPDVRFRRASLRA